MNKEYQNFEKQERIVTPEKRREKAIKALENITYVSHFNPFKVMRNGDHEIRHSNTLAWLFDKKDNHGLNDRFAVEFFSKIFTDIDWENKFSGEVTIETEVPASPHEFDIFRKAEENKNKFEENTKLENEKLNKSNSTVDVKGDTVLEKQKDKSNSAERNKKIDIFIKGEDFTITIENKYGSAEHDWQCQRYRYYINTKFSRHKNYFVFLDIERPENWYIGKDDKKENLRYEGYKFINYESVRDILKELTRDRNENENAVTYIKKYIEVLNETYGEFAPEIVAVFNENLKYGEYIHELKDINSKLKEGRSVFEKYSRELQVNNNEPIVKRILEDIIEKEFRTEEVVRDYNNKTENNNLIQYHFGAAGVTDPYAYKLAIGEYVVKKYNGFKKISETASYINEIDYKAKYGYYSIAFYFGTKTQSARKWCNTAYKNFDDFDKSLDEMMKSKEWDIWIEYNVLSGYAQGKGARIKDLRIEYTPENLKKLKKYWKKEMTDETVGRVEKDKLVKNNMADENSAVLKMIREICLDVDGKTLKEYNDIKKLVEEYFEKQKKAMTFRWTLALECRINKEQPIVTDEDRKEMETKLPLVFPQKTKEGLNLFSLGEDFVGAVFCKKDQKM